MFSVKWLRRASEDLRRIKTAALSQHSQGKSSKQQGLYKQVSKTIKLLAANPRHPGLQTHEFLTVPNPFDPSAKVFEAYAQNRTPGAYRVFWCYGPGQGEITTISIGPHP